MPVQFEIHPTIAIARVGASEAFFVGPEPDGKPPASYRDADGILRQAARFRVFRVDRDGAGAIREAREVTPDEGEITWTVHLANRKATSPPVEVEKDAPPRRRNGATGEDDKDRALIIDPGARSVSAGSPNAEFDTGSFRGTPVRLGELQFDRTTGRLVLLGGQGHSGFVKPLAKGDTAANTPQRFADNDGWFDDTSEGPVTAVVRLKATGQEIAATGARVIVGPPDFAPDIQNFVTLYDIVYQVAVKKGLAARPKAFSFMRFVHPLLVRVSRYQWVNGEAAGFHGAAAAHDFEGAMATLADPNTPSNRRQRLVNALRDPGGNPNRPGHMPRLYSQDGYPEEQFKPLALTPIQYEAMTKWAAAHAASTDFAWDFPANPFANEPLPDALDRVALEACSGGAFFPGIEAPRFMQDDGNFESTLPVRLKEDLPAGIVNAQSAVPWQADFFDCQWETHDDGNDFGWWPAQRPDSVFTDASLQERVPWAEGIKDKRQMIAGWRTRKFVLPSKGADGKTIYLLEP